MQEEVVVWLHNIRSAHNVGSIFRTADAAGASRIILSGYTPLPRDRFGRVQKEIAKTALGAEKSVAWEHCATSTQAVAKLHKEGFRIIGVEQDSRAIDYRDALVTQPTALLFGAEVRGISQALRAHCDALIEIPMHGSKESLNVSVAAGIILFSLH